ncbi:DNA mismatch repair protein MSH4 [Carpediemonas membranifera]|uniref:DNA mismatch repair protein MSH4 n=1 Tax=Carpediemonas membranifera TaxID=201153 RepID=A0A8J6AYH5_9EUKA|nr:DNA mismatch repair protein MSH4 [Carpediemonas membranifera]|eukprot:KAG9390349.1 DNA mismatch repair protein MSH4 [Carpediemonas membranifera]
MDDIDDFMNAQMGNPFDMQQNGAEESNFTLIGESCTPNPNNRSRNLSNAASTSRITPHTLSSVESSVAALTIEKSGFVSICIFFTDRNTVELYHFTDSNTFVHTLGLLSLVMPHEVLVPTNLGAVTLLQGLSEAGLRVVTLQRRLFRAGDTHSYFLAPVDTTDFGDCIGAAGAAIAYLEQTRNVILGQKTLTVTPASIHGRLLLDSHTARALCLTPTKQGQPSVASVIPTRTDDGRRALVRALLQPYTDMETLVQRQDAVAELLSNRDLHYTLQAAIAQYADLNIAQAVARLSVIPKQGINGVLRPVLDALLRVRAALTHTAELAAALAQSTHSALFASMGDFLRSEEASFAQLHSTLDAALTPDLPPRGNALVTLMRETFSIRGGGNGVLDACRAVLTEIVDDIEAHKDAVAADTGLAVGLKFSPQLLFHLSLPRGTKTLPDPLLALPGRRKLIATTDVLDRLNTRVSAALKEISAAMAGAAEELVHAVRQDLPHVMRLIDAVALVDVLLGFATFAATHECCRPTLTSAGPVLAATQLTSPLLPRDGLVGQDVSLDCGHVVWGPHGAGKSVLLQSLGVATVLAHVGCPVPAERCAVRLTDCVLARIGTEDDASATVSSFAAECSSAATALALAETSSTALVLLDEFGRGTSATDGASLAWALVEFLAQAGATPVLATHYPYLRKLAAQPMIQPFVVTPNHAVVKGTPQGANNAWGVEAAAKEGLPAAFIQKAEEVLVVLRQRSSADAAPSAGAVQGEIVRRLRAACWSSLDDAALRVWLRELQAKTFRRKEADSGNK